jgi:triosephosphate isomerase (TIM)
MKKLFIVANWKSHKSRIETIAWFAQYAAQTKHIAEQKEKTVIVCPPIIYLPRAWVSQQEFKVSVGLGAQNISPFAEGAYTGEIDGTQIKEYADYVIIGHSERRTHFAETEEMVTKKVEQALGAGLTTILCVQGKETPVPAGVHIVAYEPVTAIGSGKPDSPENANEVAKSIKQQQGVEYVLYGGSVKAENVHQFTGMEYIDGVLVGGASLDADEFLEIIKNA